MNLYAPGRKELLAIAARADLRNPHPSARELIETKIRKPPIDWDERTILTVPGIVWSVSSDTCVTGRLSAPDNIAYDASWREFVFRQPSNEAELAAIMSADSEEVFSCYRFDGASRWTARSVRAWHEDMDVVLGYVRQTLTTTLEPDVPDGLRQFEEYLTSTSFTNYLVEFQQFLES